MSVLSWERADENRGHSVARWAADGDGWVCHGSEVLVGEDTLACTFRVALDVRWRTRAVEVWAFAAAAETRRSLVSADGHWTVDGVPRPDLDGCVDVDAAATPLTNTFPIRRYADLAAGEVRTAPVAWVDVPALRVSRVEQTYERLGERRWRYADPTHGSFELTVDADGFVLDYEGFARRVSPR